jgi:hypothetical protein
MDPQALQILLIIMAVFVAVAAIALVIQAAMLHGIYKASRAMQVKIDQLTPKIETLVEAYRVSLDESRVKIGEITAKTSGILDITRRQLERFEDLFEDVATRTRVQLDRAELVVDDAMTRAQETVAAVHGGIMKPIREINGVALGLKAAIGFLLRGVRPSPDQVTADEEMFI